MATLLTKIKENRLQGEVRFFYRPEEHECMPREVKDPLELLGDISELHLNEEQKEELRRVLRRDIRERGALAVWEDRVFRKNVIGSCGRIV